MSDGPVSITFGVAFSNLPIVNIRQEFEQYAALLADPEFCAGLRIVRQPVELPTLTWRGLSHNVLTYMVQRAILGLEASVVAAVDYEMHARQMMNPDIERWLADPNKAPGERGMAQAFYNKDRKSTRPELQSLKH